MDEFYFGKIMISARKKYIIELFIKKCTNPSIMRSHIDFSLKLLLNTYQITESKLKKIKKKYNINEFIKRLIPIIDEQFTIEELQEIIKFYSSKIGKKIIDPTFLNKIDKASRKFELEIEQGVALINEEC